ncbi:MAG: hypothetical protein ACRCR1_06380 [Aeromonas sp.]
MASSSLSCASSEADCDISSAGSLMLLTLQLISSAITALLFGGGGELTALIGHL